MGSNKIGRNRLIIYYAIIILNLWTYRLMVAIPQKMINWEVILEIYAPDSLLIVIDIFSRQTTIYGMLIEDLRKFFLIKLGNQMPGFNPPLR